ncbi:hypothetical protein GTGU_00163 [Trabulsiella guamensis ATCC 49490]|uniref:Lipoprotein n=1 Tax=Trabulsiella guamensis ATCC 49490 TaxID=1005994 RepID=A0A085ASC6_9ENTR|nr:hypothetical protein [Trabulsiella guamensis]KFC13121.1 hypothetical protein GTGU_00163 [Trabulsiella guamensis ATCC 49490]
MKMKGWIYLYAIVILIAGCSASQPDKTEIQQTGNPAKCSQDEEVIYCDWDHVTDDWSNATSADFMNISK